MSSRISFFLAVLVLLTAAAFRLTDITTLPSGINQGEITDLRMVETIRQGRIEIYYNLNNEVREGLYQTVLAAHVSSVGSGLVSYRIFSVWIGMLTLAFTYAVGKRLFDPLVGLAAAALLAVNMLAILLSRTIGREVLLPGLVSAVLLTLTLALPVSMRRYSRHQGNTSIYALLGALLGSGFYVHPVGLLIALAVMIFTAYMVSARLLQSRRVRSYMSFAILLMIILAMPYLSSSIRQPDLAGANRLLGDFGGLLHSIGNGLAGFVFMGDENPISNLPGRPLIDLVSGLMMVVGIVTALRYWRQPRFGLLLIVAVVLMPSVLLATNTPNFSTYASILPLVALFFGVGIHTMVNSLNPKARRVAAAGFVILLLFNVVWTGRDLFRVWPSRDDVGQAYNSRAGQLAHYLDRTADHIPSVVCARNLNQNIPMAGLSGAQIIALMMNDQNAPLRFVDCRSGLIFINGGEEEQIILPESDTLDTMPDNLRRWLDYGKFNPDPTLPTDSVFTLNVTQPLADTIGLFTTTAPVGYSPEVAETASPIAPPIQFGGNLTFLGYEKDETSVYPPKGVVTFTTYWRVDGLIPPDLNLFVHILADPGATPAAQTDTIGVDPQKMKNRDVFIQVTRVLLPASIPDGNYSVSIGAYQSHGPDKSRLDVLDNGVPRGNRLFLYPITVKGND